MLAELAEVTSKTKPQHDVEQIASFLPWVKDLSIADFLEMLGELETGLQLWTRTGDEEPIRQVLDDWQARGLHEPRPDGATRAN